MRADASAEIGLGHVMRSVTLARALSRTGAAVRFVGVGVPGGEVQSATSDGVQFDHRRSVTGDASDAQQLVSMSPDLVVVDGYHFDDTFFETLDNANVTHAVVDDNAETVATRPAAVINQNPHAIPQLYEHFASHPMLLLGLDYALIRPEVLRAAAHRPVREPGTVFVAMGGSDPSSLTVPLVAALAGTPRRIRVAVGPAHPDRDAIVASLDAWANVEVVEPDRFVRALATSSIAVLASGTSLWEAVCLGTPTLGVITAANQRDSGRAALDGHLISQLVDAADHETVHALADAVADQLTQVAATDPGVDLGHGADRCAEALRRLLIG